TWRTGTGIGLANPSADQYTPVVGSNSPRVVGASYTGGRTVMSVRSPTSSRSSSPTQRWRSGGTPSAAPIRSRINQLTTTIAFGAGATSASRLPVWSTSSWVRNTHRMSCGSTIENTSARNVARFSGIPVSTTTGSADRITIALSGTSDGEVPSPAWSWMTN